jgi:hypothetical protein
MTVVKTLRLVRHHDRIKYIVFVTIHDRPISETIIVGPTRYFTKRVLVMTGRDISEGEVDYLVSKVLISDMRCRRCGYHGPYTKIEIKNGEPDIESAVCSNCDPSAAYALGLFEAIDIAFIETRDN